MQDSSIQQFEHEQFGKIRAAIIDGEPWFLVSDICTYFGITNRNRVLQQVDEEDKGGTQMDTPGGNQTVAIVNESGLYTILFYIQPKKARGISDEEIEKRYDKIKRFKRWVTHEVLPSIRRHGMYATPQTVDEMLADPDTMIRTLKALKAERQKVQALTDDNARMLPKALAYDSFIDTDGTYSITSAARFMAQIDKTITRNRLFGYLRADEIICKSTREPTKKGIQRGYVKQTAAKKANGDAAQPYARLTQKGLDWCISHYCKVPVQMQTV